MSHLPKVPGNINAPGVDEESANVPTSPMVDGYVVQVNSSLDLELNYVDNQNISSSANISGTKVNPNFGSQNISTTGDLSVNDITASGNLGVINITASGDLGVNDIVATGNISGVNITATGDLDAVNADFSGDLNVNDIIATGNISGVNITASGDLNVNDIVATGNLTVVNITASGSMDITGDITSDGYINTIKSVNDSNNFFFTGTSVNGAPVILAGDTNSPYSTLTLDDETAYALRITCVAGSVTDRACFIHNVLAYRESTVTIELDNLTFDGTNGTVWTFAITASGTDLVLTFTGNAGEDIKANASVELVKVKRI